MELNLFYEEPDDDRWVPLDRYPRRLVRRIVRGKPQPGGHQRTFLNLRAGLDRLGITYRVNDYRYATRNPAELACIVGKPCVLAGIPWRNPILLGPAIYSHPVDDPDLLDRLPVRKILAYGPWMERMCKSSWGDAVASWPVGIDTDLWRPAHRERKQIDVLLYDKVRWNHDQFEQSLIVPIRRLLQSRGHSFLQLRYGSYREDDFHSTLARSRAMIFLCEHETQGIAYQQALSCGVPILAWDRGGYWQDPSYYPHKVKFGPVSSVPYWDERCGGTFTDAGAFPDAWSSFWESVRRQLWRPRDYILENLTLEKCARDYVALAREIH
jgi:glycosyltransferase involved in cell wall biosynthesis